MTKGNIVLEGYNGKVIIELNDLQPEKLIKLIELANQILEEDKVKNGEENLSELDKELLAYIRKGQKLQAVKRKKDVDNMGLKEAKEYCDLLQMKHSK